MTLHELAARLTVRLCVAGNFQADKKRENRITFALEGVLSTGYSFLVILLVSLLLGTVKETIAVVLFAGSVRVFAGGVHAATPTRCALFGGIIGGLLGLGAKYLPRPTGYFAPIIIFLFLAAVILVFAPRETANKKIPPEQKRVLKMRTALVLLVFFFVLLYFVNNPFLTKALLLGMGWQALTVSPVLKEKGINQNEGRDK